MTEPVGPNKFAEAVKAYGDILTKIGAHEAALLSEKRKLATFSETIKALQVQLRHLRAERLAAHKAVNLAMGKKPRERKAKSA